MDQKKIQRIIGIVVVIALVVVVMPLILGKNDIPMLGSTTDSNKPSLPEQSATVASDTVVHSSPSETNTTTAMVEPANSMSPTADIAPTNSMDTGSANSQDTTAATPTLPTPPALSSTAQKTPADAAQKPAETMDMTDKLAPAPGSVVYEPVTPTPAAPIASATPPPAATPQLVAPTSTQNVESTSAVPQGKSDSSTIKIKQAVMKEKKSAPKSIIAVHAKTKPSLQKVKSGWVVQMGNFAVKKNAVRLAKQLRAAGYKVFTQDIKTGKGKTNTRVYIGPELKQASATKLSNDIHHRMNMQGYVMSYKL